MLDSAIQKSLDAFNADPLLRPTDPREIIAFAVINCGLIQKLWKWESALEFYSSESRWPMKIPLDVSPIALDRGEVARKALDGD